MEFVEMFKAPIKVLHPLLTATEEGNYKGTEGFGAIPFDGVVLAHSNESEWQTFRNNKNNEAFLDRINIVKVPDRLRVSDEVKIYQKLLQQQLAVGIAVRPRHPADAGAVRGADPHQGPRELHGVFQDAHLRRREPQGHRPEGQVLPGVPGLCRCRRGYDRHLDSLRVQDPVPGVQLRPCEMAANPVHLLYVLEQQIEQEQLPPEMEQRYVAYLKEYLSPHYAEYIEKELQTATWSLIPNTARTSSTATSPTPTCGSRTRSSATRTPARSSTAPSSTRNWRRSRSRPASPTRRTSATRWSTSCCARAPRTTARTRPGPATRSCAR